MTDNTQEVFIPDIGGAENVDVIEILVKPGDTINIDDPLATLEGDKASMDVPSPIAGKVKAIHIKVGDKVSEGAKILTLEGAAESAVVKEAQQKEPAPEKAPTQEVAKPQTKEAPQADYQSTSGSIHAGPAVRRIAREFDIDLTQMQGSGEKGRITKEDMQQFVKQQLQIAASGGSSRTAAFPAAPKVDFSKFGPIETSALSKIKKMTGVNMSRNWVSIPHVTQFGEADISELEQFRQNQKKLAEKRGVRLTPLVFLMKAAVAALKAYPNFNASLDPSGEQLILKKYFHIGVAVDTPNGLVVPVIRDVDQKSLFELAEELNRISVKAREKGLSIAEMQGGCFTISSLGGIGGTAFTPIINAPEVAILGVSRTETKPVFINGEFKPRLMLPLSLSYDHRVIDGADGARFMVYLSECLNDIRTLLL